jgi:branched-chain amino acid transport system permease protein
VNDQLLSDVLSLAPVYGLLAAGFVIVYRFTGVLNFSHGALTALGAYCIYLVSAQLGVPPVLSIALVTLLGAVVGVVAYWLVIRPMKGRPVFATVLITIALGIVIESLIVLAWSSAPKSVAEEFGFAREVRELFGNASIATGSAMMWVAFLGVLAVIAATLRWTRFGIQGRAGAEDQLLASYRGIHVEMTFLAAWAAAAAMAFLAGGIYATHHSVQPEIALLALKGFPVAMLGGLDSLKGVLVAAVIVAGAESLALQHIGPRLGDIVPYATMLVVLMVRPWGLWGTREELDRV